MADYNINADITANTKGYEAGIKKAQESTKKFSTSLSKVIQGLGKNGLVGAMGSIGLASAGLSATLGAVVKIAKQVSQAIGECTEAYKKQLIAERQLETAINNNPLVTGSAKKRLTEFASELQKISNYGDEELIPMMANLVSLGRTEEETMKIMAVAMDMSASGSMSLDTAINQLNATLNGNIGRLGQQNAELKGLTEEELKSGKAVEILGEKFKGLSQATLDTSTQLKNVKGDFKEAIGEFTLPTSDMWNKFWAGFYEKGIDIIHRLQASIDSSKGEGIYEKLAGSVKKIKNEEAQREAIQDALSMSSEIELNQLQTYLEGLKKRNALQDKTLEQVQKTLEYRKEAERAYEKGRALEEQDEARRQAELEKQKAKEKEITDLKDEYLKKIAEQERKWQNIKDVTGEQVSNEEKIKFYQDSLVDLMTQANGQITTNNQLYKDQIAIIQGLQAELKPKEEEQNTSDVWAKKIREQTIERLEAEKEYALKSEYYAQATAQEKFNIEKKYNDQLKQLHLQKIQEERANALESIKGVQNEEEEKARITEYYQNEIIKNAGEYSTILGEEGAEAGMAFGEEFGAVLIVLQKIGDGVKKIFSKVVENIKKDITRLKNQLKTMFSNFKKIFDFDPDSALEGLLKFEDKVMTFFLETIPKLPSFFESALQSISVLLSTIELNISEGSVKAMITNFIGIIKRYLPDIVKTGLLIAREIINGFAKGIRENKAEIGEILNSITEVIVTLLPESILTIVKTIGDLISAIPQEAIVMVINAVIEMFTQIAMAVIDNAVVIAEKLIPALFQILKELLKNFPQILKTVLWEVIKGMGEIAGTLWEGVKSLFGWETGTNNAPKGLALVGEAGPELVDFKGGERVINNHNTQKILADSGKGSSVFNVTFNNTQDTTAFAMMNQLKQYQRNLAFNGVL